MEVSPNQSVVSRGQSSGIDDDDAMMNGQLDQDFSEEEDHDDDNDEPIATRRSRRKRKPVAYTDEVEILSSRRSSRRTNLITGAEKEGEEYPATEFEDSKQPAAGHPVIPFPIGIKIRKSFTSGDFAGEVVSGPKMFNKERVWHVIYEDGDEEDMNWAELMQWVVEEQFLDPPCQATCQTIATRQSRIQSPHRGGKKPNQEPVYTLYAKDYGTALTDLKYKMGTTEEEIMAALEKMKPPYSMNEAMQRIHKAREDPDSFVPREKFVIRKGMRVRKHYDGSQYYGTVVNDEAEWINDQETGTRVKMWEVLFDDGTREDMDFNELRECYAGRPTRTHPARGRQLCALELFCGCGIVSQHFAERKWRVRSIDNRPNSYATDVVDIMKLRYQDFGMVPDFLWASLPCHTYSNMAGGAHRSNEPGLYAKTEEARMNDRLLTQLVAIMRWAKNKNPNLIVALENPVGLLRKMPLMAEVVKNFGLEMAQVDYCAFGRDDKKPTCIWTNSFDLYKHLDEYKCAKKCPYYEGIHPIGARANGHQYNSAAIPDALAEEVAHNVDATCYFQRYRHNPQATLTKEEEEDFNELMAK